MQHSRVVWGSKPAGRPDLAASKVAPQPGIGRSPGAARPSAGAPPSCTVCPGGRTLTMKLGSASRRSRKPLQGGKPRGEANAAISTGWPREVAQPHAHVRAQRRGGCVVPVWCVAGRRKHAGNMHSRQRRGCRPAPYPHAHPIRMSQARKGFFSMSRNRCRISCGSLPAASASARSASRSRHTQKGVAGSPGRRAAGRRAAATSRHAAAEHS